MDDFLSQGIFSSFVDELTDAAVRLIADAGTTRLSIGVVAGGIGMRRQSLTTRLRTQAELWSLEGSPVGVLHQVIVIRFGPRWRDWSTEGFYACSPGQMPAPAVPHTDDQRSAVRIWHGLRQLASADLLAGEPGPADAIAEQRELERAAMRHGLHTFLGRPASPLTVAALQAFVDGVQLAASDHVDPLSPMVAQGILESHLRGLLVRGYRAQARTA